jgi:hypothetical protein
MKKQLEAQPLPLGALFSFGWRLYNENFSDLLRIILWVYIPINLAIAFAPLTWTIPDDGTGAGPVTLSFAPFLEIFIGLIAAIAIAALVEQAVEGEHLAWSAALRYGLARWLPALGTELLGALIILGLTFLLIIPGIIWAIYYAFSLYAVALRNVRGRGALAYSKGLVQGQWWRVCGILLMTSLLGQIVLLAISALLLLIADNPVAEFIINSTIDVIAGFFTVVTVLFFLNTDYVKQKE